MGERVWKIFLTLKSESMSLKYTQLLFSNPIEYIRIFVSFQVISQMHPLFTLETSKFIVKLLYTLGLVF